ncbi:hypothetical protein Scep_019142 [Stephania cephalantha]|uniref:Uncharacterized protein n=1 Tax=Stephania cephalantha TaxID=152367 RepID=A0AAP0NLV6_9MAGN
MKNSNGLGKYLDVQMVEGQSQREMCNGIVENHSKIVMIWREEFLTPPGMETLLKAVEQALPSHHMSIFLFLKAR